jgi:hypothetical protein
MRKSFRRSFMGSLEDLEAEFPFEQHELITGVSEHGLDDIIRYVSDAPPSAEGRLEDLTEALPPAVDGSG